MHLGILSDPSNFHTRKWVRVMEKLGVQVTVFTFNEYSGKDLNVIRVKPPFASGANFNMLSYLVGGKRLRAKLDKEKIDFLCAFNATPFGVWATRSRFHPLAVFAFGSDILEYPPTVNHHPQLKNRRWEITEPSANYGASFLGEQKRKLFRKWVGQTLKNADVVFADNQHVIESIQNWFGIEKAKVNLLRWGVEAELFEANDEELANLRKDFGIHQGNKFILSPRGAKAVYQADIIVDAFIKMLEAGTENVQFLMLSAGYEVAESIRNKISLTEKKFPGKIILHESLIPHSELYKLWNLVDIFISAPVYDGYSAALAEGRYIGAIPVVNAIPGNLELIGHDVNGWITDPFTADQLAEDLKQLLQHSDAYKAKFAMVNKRWIEENSILEKNVKKFLEKVEGILNK